MKQTILILCFLAVSFCGCNSRSSVQAETLVLPESDVYIGGYGEELFTWDKPYRWVHWDDSRLCSTCLLKQYYLWDELIDSLGTDSIDYIFILEPREDYSEKTLSSVLNENYFSHPIIIDRSGFFDIRNGIKTVSGSIDILTDRSGKIVLVGDLRNDYKFYQRVKRKIS